MGGPTGNTGPTSAHGTFGDTAPRLIANGYVPIPLKGKIPVTRGYNKIKKYSDDGIRHFLEKFGHLNTGVLMGELIAIDIDIMEPANAAHEMAALAMEILGVTDFIRIGKPPKRVLLYRTDQDIYTRKKSKVEILAIGAHIAAFGTHPDTGQAYRWPFKSIIDCPIHDLPTVSEEAVKEFHDVALKQQGIDPYLSSELRGPVGRRNTDLFLLLKEAALSIDNPNGLREKALTINAGFDRPLPSKEVKHTATSVWQYKTKNRLFFPKKQSVVLPIGKEQIIELARNPKVLALYSVLKATRHTASFTIPMSATAKRLSWGKGSVSRAIEHLRKSGLIEIEHRPPKMPGRQKPILYRFGPNP